jgi:hypothetical protein
MPHLFVSGLTLFEGEVDAEAYAAAKEEARKIKEAKVLWDNAVAAANAALNNDEYTIVVGTERTALEAEVAKAEPTTTDGYNNATADLNTATNAFTAAKADFEAFYAAKAGETPVLAYATDEKKNAVEAAKAVADPTSAADADTKTAAITTALRAYYESHAMAESVATAVNKTTSIANYDATDGNNGWTWTGNKNNPRNTESWTDSNGKNDYMYFDGGDWSANSWTTTMKQTINIPAGKYLLTAKGRAAANTTLTMAVGEVSVELPHIGADPGAGVFGRGWGDTSIEFVTKGRGDEIVVTATTNSQYEWFSISDFRLVQLEDHAAAVAVENLQTAILEAQAAMNTESQFLENLTLAATETATTIQYKNFIGGSEAAALAVALQNAGTVDVTNVDAVQAADAALTAATAAYIAAAPAYERVALTGIVAQRLGLTSDASVVALQAQAQNTATVAADIEASANEVIKNVLAPKMEIKVNLKLGFEKDEYAPYNNVKLLQTAVASKAIGEDPASYTNEQIGILVVDYLNGLPTTQNAEDLDAIYDGKFANTAANTTTGDITLPGWTKVQGIRLLVKDEATDPGLAYTDGKAAVFSWGATTLTYGEQTGYTLPLNKHELYELTFKVSGWRDGGMPSVLTASLDGQSQTINPVGVGRINTTEGNPFVSVRFVFEALEDNSKLTIYANQHFTIADLSLVKATPEDVTISVSAAEYATIMVPFEAAVPAGLTVSEITGVNGNMLVRNEVTTIEANKPYLVSGAEGNYTVNGVIPTGLANSYTNGLLTGVYAETDAPVGSYVLQNLTEKDGVAFYVVEDGAQPKVKANRAYLTVPAAGGDVKAFLLGEGTNAIETVNAKTAQNGAIYNIAGQRVEKAVKGLYIKNGKKVLVK